MVVVFFAICLGIITGLIARSKRRSFFLWWIYGTLLFIVAIVHVLIISPGGARKCPHCAELIKEEAAVCKHCGRSVTDSEKQDSKDKGQRVIRSLTIRIARSISLFALIIIAVYLSSSA